MKLPALFKFLLGCTTLLLIPSSGPAQAPPIAPEGPLLNHVPENYRWEISFRYGSKADPQDNAVPVEKAQGSGPAMLRDGRRTKIIGIKTPGISYEETLTRDGERSRRWRRGNVEIVQLSRNGPFAVADAASSLDLLASGYGGHDFPDVNWVSKKSFIGIEKTNEIEHLVFQEKVAVKVDAVILDLDLRNEPVEGFLTTVWVDLQSRLPLKWNRGEETRTFRYAPTTSVPEIPEPVRQLFAFNETPVKPARVLRP
jgi:hypothetical protein